MTGQELKQKLESVGIPQAKLADMIGVFPQSFNKTLKSDNVSTSVLEKLCQVLGKDMGFFYDIKSTDQEVTDLRKKLQEVLQENKLLKSQLEHQADPNKLQKESEVYKLWMEHMKIEKMREDFNDKMRELYQKMMEDK